MHITHFLFRMSVGLGMTTEEWEDLKSQVDNSFWVMRVIGKSRSFENTRRPDYMRHSEGYPPLPNDYDGFSCGAHK